MIICYQVFPSGWISFSVSVFINFVWIFVNLFSFSWSHARPQSNFKKLKMSFSSYSCSELPYWGQGWAEASLSTFLWLYIIVCAVVQKYHEMLS